MKFAVRWKELAIDDLTSIWLSANSQERRGITAAQREVDRQLEVDPDVIGESRPGDRRIMFVAPLAITFRVNVKARKVVVLRVRQFH